MRRGRTVVHSWGNYRPQAVDNPPARDPETPVIPGQTVYTATCGYLAEPVDYFSVSIGGSVSAPAASPVADRSAVPGSRRRRRYLRRRPAAGPTPSMPSAERCVRCSQRPKSCPRDGITRSGMPGLTTRSWRVKWTGSDQLASAMGLTTSEYSEASPMTARLCRPCTSIGMSPASVTRLSRRYWSS